MLEVSIKILIYINMAPITKMSNKHKCLSIILAILADINMVYINCLF